LRDSDVARVFDRVRSRLSCTLHVQSTIPSIDRNLSARSDRVTARAFMGPRGPVHVDKMASDDSSLSAMTLWRSTPALLAMLVFTHTMLFVPAVVATVLELPPSSTASDGHGKQKHTDVAFMLLWHLVVAPSLVWHGPNSWASFAAGILAVAVLPLLFLRNTLARTMYGLAGVVLLGGRESFLPLAAACVCSVNQHAR
jgi:hypothetical protein